MYYQQWALRDLERRRGSKPLSPHHRDVPHALAPLGTARGIGNRDNRYERLFSPRGLQALYHFIPPFTPSDYPTSW